MSSRPASTMGNWLPRLVTAGGKITCRQCSAKSKRSGLQCGRPAMSGKAVCNFHGGKSTGPRTKEGKYASGAAHTKSGQYSRKALDDHSKILSRLRQLEDAMYIQGMTTSPRTSGRKPNGYVPISTMRSVMFMLLDISWNKPPQGRS